MAEASGSPDGPPEERLAYLAGLLHDAAKAAADWQQYILDDRRHRRQGPPHAPLGAALFAYAAEQMIVRWPDVEDRDRPRLRDLALDWARLVDDHHGSLSDLEDTPPWETASPVGDLTALARSCDLRGLSDFLEEVFPGLRIERPAFETWLETFPEKWERRVRRERDRVLRKHAGPAASPADLAPFGLRLRDIGARLIGADRVEAGGLDRDPLDPADAAAAADRVDAHCDARAEAALAGGAASELVRARQRVRDEALVRYRSAADRRFYSLLLPTGYGKTLTGLRIALEACRSGRCQRIVYVGPYLSILSQAALEIQRASGLSVFQHHHASVAQFNDQYLDELVDMLDTWQTPVVATTFNQLFRALFPQRAQECLRLGALRGAFVLIDEPQAIATRFWNVFLRALSVTAAEHGCVGLFATATMPGTEWGLSEPVVPLAPPVSPPGRYTVRVKDTAWKAPDLVEAVEEAVEEGSDRHEGRSVAVILNTVRDAASVFRELDHRLPPEVARSCLTALMLPGHKAKTIATLRRRLARGRPVVVVCTQVLEAGVDLSFDRLFRALPIFPSVAQAAGRANRHGSEHRASVDVFRYLREDETDTRPYVYRDPTARRQTDRLLPEETIVEEEQMGPLLDGYFRACVEENRNTAELEQFERAARGAWSALSGLEPFELGPPRTEVFVPRRRTPLTWTMGRLLHRFAPEGPDQLLERYMDPGYRRGLGYGDRKRLSAILREFTVPVPDDVAAAISTSTAFDWLREVDRVDRYAETTGLAHVLDAGGAPEPAALVL